MSLLTIWVFIVLVLLWAGAFILVPTAVAAAWSDRLGTGGRVALFAFGLLVYLPMIVMFAMWLAQWWADLVGVPA